ncbi:hypothetical protein ACA106_15615 [Agrobacterium pusense]|uniref:hypothetical protein n=1 Tax=Agrobacterium pusense TaxID=648995 RepID=UPI0035A5C49A
MADDISDEELERRMSAKLFGPASTKATQVEIRRGVKRKHEPVEMRFINCVESYNGEWMWCEVEQKMSSGWVKQETFEDRERAERAAEKYQRNGDIVTWWSRKL